MLANPKTLQQCNRDVINTVNISEGVLFKKFHIDVWWGPKYVSEKKLIT